MPKYPRDLPGALRIATTIASRFGNLECDQCARGIVQALGPNLGIEVVKLVSDHSDIIGLANADLQITETGLHVGVKIGNAIVDNHHPNGIPDHAWPGQFISGVNKPLRVVPCPAADFFARRFLRKRFDRFVSSKD
jgi:hypothetical protein